MLDKRAVNNKHTASLFASEYFRQWVDNKYRKLIPFVWLVKTTITKYSTLLCFRRVLC